MKKLIVIFFLVCIALGEWQQSDETALPKGIQVNDLKISNSGEIWILSTSSLLKYETKAQKSLLMQRFKDGKLFAMLDNKVFIIDDNNHLITIELNNDNIHQSNDLVFNSPDQIVAAVVNDRPFQVIKELNKLTFVSNGKTTGSLNTIAERFNIIPSADYNDTKTPLYTLINNRIYSWTGGSFSKPEAYEEKILYSSSQTIIDFSSDKKRNLYVLFSDSIVILDSNGDYKNKASVDNISLASRIFTNHVNNNNIVVFDNLQKSLIFLTEINKSSTGEVITLNDNRPNPVDNYTEVEFTISEPLGLTITVYNLIGEPVRIIAEGRYPKGTHRVVWHADDEKGNLVPNGIYFYRLESKKGVAIKQLIVLR